MAAVLVMPLRPGLLFECIRILCDCHTTWEMEMAGPSVTLL